MAVSIRGLLTARSDRLASFFLVGCCGLILHGHLAAAPAFNSALVAINKIAAQLEGCQALPSHQDTTSMDGCFSDALTAAENVLSETYQTAVAQLRPPKGAAPFERKDDAEIGTRLATAQRAWTAYREAQCSLEGSTLLGGSGEAAQEMSCAFKMTRDRIRFLVQWLGDYKR